MAVTKIDKQAARPVLKVRGAFDADELRETARAAVVVDLGRPREARLRPTACPDRPMVKRAMAAVEARLVEAVWVLSRLPDREHGWLNRVRHGIEYRQDSRDRWANAVDPATGLDAGFGATPVRPAPPAAAAIDRMYAPLTWLQQLDRRTAIILFTACLSMRGDPAANISWRKVREAVGGTLTRQRLTQIYQAGLREIAGEQL